MPSAITIVDLNQYLLLTGGTLTGNLRIADLQPEYLLEETDAAVDEGLWGLRANNNQFAIRAINDAFTVGINAILIDRTGTVIDTITFLTDTVQLLNGGIFRINDASNVDNAKWLHDGVDFNLVLQNTTDYNITGLANLVVGGRITSTADQIRVQSLGPEFILEETDALADEKLWGLRATGGMFLLRTINDAFSAANTVFQVTRTGITIDRVIFTPPVQVGMFGANNTTPIAKPTVTGSRGGNVALTSLLTALANYGLITDSTT